MKILILGTLTSAVLLIAGPSRGIKALGLSTGLVFTGAISGRLSRDREYQLQLSDIRKVNREKISEKDREIKSIREAWNRSNSLIGKHESVIESSRQKIKDLQDQLEKAHADCQKIRKEYYQHIDRIQNLENNRHHLKERLGREVSVSESRKKLADELQRKIEQEASKINQFESVMVEKLKDYLLTVGQDLLENIERSISKNDDEGIVNGLGKTKDILIDKLSIFEEILQTVDIKEIPDVWRQFTDELSALKTRYINTLNLKYRKEVYQASKTSVSREYAISQLKTVTEATEHFELASEECKQSIDALIATRDKLISENESLRQQLADLKGEERVTKFNPAITDLQRQSNLIIDYFYRLGVKLDRGYIDNKGTKAKVFFHVDQNDPPIHIKFLNEHGEALQDLISSHNEINFSRETNGLISTVVKNQPDTKEKLTRSQLSKILLNPQQFSELAKDFSRVRITGGSESGKSPTAENLACIIVEHKRSKGNSSDCFLFNPQYNSEKNYWTIPVVGTSHSDSAKGIKDLAKLVDERSKGASREEFKLMIFDEVDSTLSSNSRSKEISESVKFIIKQASHQNLGAIFIGQSANVSNYPGLSRSDWESAVSIHIGGNALHAIQNSNMGTKLKQKLETQYEEISGFVEEENNRLGLESDSPKYIRFALVIDPKKSPYWVELWEFGWKKYQADDNPKPDENLVKCPSCMKETSKKTGTTKTGRQRYRCLNNSCSRKTFSV